MTKQPPTAIAHNETEDSDNDNTRPSEKISLRLTEEIAAQLEAATY